MQNTAEVLIPALLIPALVDFVKAATTAFRTVSRSQMSWIRLNHVIRKQLNLLT